MSPLALLAASLALGFGARAQEPANPYGFDSFFGANVLHGAYWLPDRDAAARLFDDARAMNLSIVRVPLPLNLAAAGNGFTPASMASRARSLLDWAQARGLRVILVMDGYTPYEADATCGYKVGFLKVAPIARRVARAVKGHPALFAWDLLNEPLSGADGMGCPKELHPSIEKAVRAMRELVRAVDPAIPTTVGEAYPEYQKTWNGVVEFASPHLYFPDVKSPVTDDMLATMRQGLESFLGRLRQDVAPAPLVVGEFGFDASGPVDDGDQARAYRAYGEVLRKEDVGALFWQLDVGGFTVLDPDYSWKPAAFVIQEQRGRNAVEIVDQEAPPASMQPGDSADVSVTVRNAGTTSWTEATPFPYRLGAQNPQDNTSWLADAPDSPGHSRVTVHGVVEPGRRYTFSFTITAPSQLGDYHFQWRMVQDGVEWFGDRSPDALIHVGQQ